MRKPLIAGNWKMHKTIVEAVDTATQIAVFSQDVKGVDVLIAPPFTALAPVAQALDSKGILLAGQNLHFEPQGAFTGEISGAMLKSAGCSHVIVGHSERRQYFGETDDLINKKVHAAIRHGLVPILCIGETEAQREANETYSVLDKQLLDGLKDTSFNDPDALIIAYEPVWAIGTGKTATSNQAQQVHEMIRATLKQTFGSQVANGIRILYGGSVKPENISELMGMEDIDGALVGGASLDAEVFGRIIRFT